MVTVEGHEKLCRLVNACRQGADNTTPMSLVQEMIDKIPEEIWKDTSATILDPAAGSGTFLVAAYWKMIQAGDTHENIISNRLFACEINLVYLKIIKDKLGIKNIYDKDFLQLDLDMKFDVVIGNPPYQDPSAENGSRNLWSKFIVDSLAVLKERGTLALITPQTWMSARSRNNSTLDILSSNNIIYVNNKIGHFFKGIGSTFCYFFVSKEENKGETLFEGLESRFDLSKYPYIPNQLEGLSIHIKTMFREDHIKINWSSRGGITQYRELLDENGRYELISTTGKKPLKLKTPLNHYNISKVIVNVSGNLKPIYDEGKYSCSQNTTFIEVKNAIEASRLIGILNSKLYTYILSTSKFTGFFNHATLRLLPLLDLTRDWSDQEIYRHFKLTQKEINLIEDTKIEDVKKRTFA